MGKTVFAALLLSGLGAGSGDQPDGRLVLGVAGGGPERVVVADPVTGSARSRRLPGGTLCHGPVLALGGRILYGGHSGRLPVLRSLPLTLRGHARSLGRADTFTLSATPGRIWLGDWGRPVRRWSDRPAPVELREVDPAGRVTTRVHSRMPRFGALQAATAEGFIVSQGRFLTLRRGQRTLRRVRDGWLRAAGRSRLAWCRGGCERLVVRGPDGERVVAPTPRTRPAHGGGAFSPSERRLAVPVELSGRTRAAVVDLRSGRWTLVPGGGYGALAWSPSGRWLYMGGAGRSLRAWRIGAAHSTALRVDVPGDVLTIATSR